MDGIRGGNFGLTWWASPIHTKIRAEPSRKIIGLKKIGPTLAQTNLFPKILPMKDNLI